MSTLLKKTFLNKKIMPYLFLCLAQLMVAFNVIGSKLVITHISFLMAVFLRFSFATLIIFTLYFLQGNVKKEHFKLSRKHGIILIIQGLCAGLFFNLFLMMGLQYTSASMAGILISLLPAVIALAAVIFLKEKLSFFQIAGIVLALLGLLIINGGFSDNKTPHSFHEMLGCFLLLLALIPETAYYLLSKQYQNELPLLVFSGLLNAVNVLSLLPLVLWYEPKALRHLDNFTLEVLFTTGVASAIFYLSWAIGIKHVNASKAGLLTALCPIMTLLLAAFFLHEQITHLQLIGMSVVIASVMLSNKK